MKNMIDSATDNITRANCNHGRGAGEHRPALAPDQRPEQQHRGEASDRQHLPHRVGAEQPFAERIIAAE